MGIQLGIGLTGQRVGFSPSSLFAASEPGIWLDPSDLTTLFQDIAGTTPVTTAGQTVALALDKSRGLVRGPNVVINGDFSSGTSNWSSQLSATLTAVSGGLRVSGQAGTAFSLAFQIVTASLSTAVEITWTATVEALGSTNPRVGIGAIVRQFSSSGTYSVVVLGGRSDNKVDLNPGTDGVVRFSNISVRELAGNHATQATAESRPLFAQHPTSGVRNQANGSADVGNAAFWPAAPVQNGITATKVASGFDVDGLPYVDVRYQGTATAGFHALTYVFSQSRFAIASGLTFTSSALVQRTGGSVTGVTGLYLESVEETAPSTTVGITGSSETTATAETLISASRTITTGNQARTAVVLLITNGATIDVTYRIKGLQIERGASRTNYQFNYANFNIVEPPFAQRNHLLFAVLRDWLQTPAVNFSATDKMTVIAGLRKLSDVEGIICELTADSASLSGAFALSANSPGGTQQYRFRSRGSLIANAQGSVNYSGADTAVLSGIGDIAGDSVTLRRNGTQIATSAADQGTGNFANDIIYIGRRGGTSLPFNGRLYGLIVRGALTSGQPLTNAENWMNARTGAY